MFRIKGIIKKCDTYEQVDIYCVSYEIINGFFTMKDESDAILMFNVNSIDVIKIEKKET